MTDDEYAQTQEELLVLARWVNGLDLDGFLARISTAETIAPILDPTLYLRGGQQLQGQTPGAIATAVSGGNPAAGQ